MTITLHWWYLPLLMIAAGIYLMVRPNPPSRGCVPNFDLWAFVLFPAFLLGGICMVIGHYLH